MGAMSVKATDIMTRIALVLRRQHSLGYIPANERRDGRWRKVKARIKPPHGLPHLTVRAADRAPLVFFGQLSKGFPIARKALLYRRQIIHR